LQYGDALAYLDGHTNLEAIAAGVVAGPSLDRIREVVGLMGDPQGAYPVLHLTGTNGKGSTARILTALLVARGLSTGTYTSPHLERINERLAWNGAPISDGALAEVIGAVADLEALLSAPPSFFEIVTAAAFRWFADIAVDAAVVEVGLGGRWDATNVADGDVAVVTNVSLDHVEYLGDSLVGIANEKAGIVKPGSTLVLGETTPELAAPFRAAGAATVWERERDFACTSNRLAHGGRLLDLRTPGARYEGLYLGLHGAHQGDNAVLALAAAEAFFGSPLGADVVAEAFASVRVPGRLEILGRRPLVVLDGAHNPAGAQAAAAAVAETFGDVSGRILVVGMLRGRDPAEMLEALGAVGARTVVACPPPWPRAIPETGVVAAAQGLGVEAVATGSVPEALARAMAIAEPSDLVLVTGSLYVVGAARSALVHAT
jgi:dihydrofolate synthase/folylpolyglutamate synthase